MGLASETRVQGDFPYGRLGKSLPGFLEDMHSVLVGGCHGTVQSG